MKKNEFLTTPLLVPLRWDSMLMCMYLIFSIHRALRVGRNPSTEDEETLLDEYMLQTQCVWLAGADFL